jgi:DNA-binding XRE family transcriptional regulator
MLRYIKKVQTEGGKFPMSIGTRVMQIRNQKGLSQRQLSERSGIAGSYLSRIENRRLEPRPKTLRKIAEALGIPVSDLFQERPTGSGTLQCVITSSGNCIMELLRSSHAKPARPGTENYSPRQLHLLRMTNYLIQTGDARTLDTLEVLVNALLSADQSKSEASAPPSSAARASASLPNS